MVGLEAYRAIGFKQALKQKKMNLYALLTVELVCIHVPKEPRKRICGVLHKHLRERFHELAVSNVMGHIKDLERSCDSEVPRSPGNEFHWQGFLGSRVFCFDDRP